MRLRICVDVNGVRSRLMCSVQLSEVWNLRRTVGFDRSVNGRPDRLTALLGSARLRCPTAGSGRRSASQRLRSRDAAPAPELVWCPPSSWYFSASHWVCGKARSQQGMLDALPRGATPPQAPWGAPFGRSACTPLPRCGPGQYARCSLRTTPCIDADGEL